jgi:hypothetical protein
MTSKTKITLAAALIAAFATPALAQGLVPYANYPTQRPSHQTQAPFFATPSYATQAPRFVERRNTAVSGDFATSNSGRDFMVQSLGN